MAIRGEDTHQQNRAFMIRRVTSVALLLVLAGLQAVPLAGSLCAATPNCCTGVMCPMHRHQTPDQQAPGKTHMDCAGNMPGDHFNLEWSGCSCSDRRDRTVGLGFYVLSQPASLAVAFVTSSLAKPALEPELAASQTPDPPPPRFLNA
jgi:hypothetical protein